MTSGDALRQVETHYVVFITPTTRCFTSSFQYSGVLHQYPVVDRTDYSASTTLMTAALLAVSEIVRQTLDVGLQRSPYHAVKSMLFCRRCGCLWALVDHDIRSHCVHAYVLAMGDSLAEAGFQQGCWNSWNDMRHHNVRLQLGHPGVDSTHNMDSSGQC